MDRFDLKTGFYGILSMQIVATSCMTLCDPDKMRLFVNEHM